MTYRQAKKLRKGETIIFKRMDVPMRVTAVRWDDKTVTIEVEDEFDCALELTHLQIKAK